MHNDQVLPNWTAICIATHLKTIIVLHSQYSKIQLFCSMIHMLTNTNEPHALKLKISQVLFLQVQLFNYFINLISWIVSKWFLVCKSLISHVTQSDDMIYHLLLSWAFTELCFVVISYLEVEIPGRVVYYPL